MRLVHLNPKGRHGMAFAAMAIMQAATTMASAEVTEEVATVVATNFVLNISRRSSKMQYL
jgi:hypothetical protein